MLCKLMLAGDDTEESFVIFVLQFTDRASPTESIKFTLSHDITYW